MKLIYTGKTKDVYELENGDAQPEFFRNRGKGVALLHGIGGFLHLGAVQHLCDVAQIHDLIGGHIAFHHDLQYLLFAVG